MAFCERSHDTAELVTNWSCGFGCFYCRGGFVASGGVVLILDLNGWCVSHVVDFFVCACHFFVLFGGLMCWGSFYLLLYNWI